MRITKNELQAMFEGTKAAALLAGVDSSHWVLYHGESYYRLVSVGPEGSGHRSIVSFLGHATKDTYNALSFMRESFYLVSQANA